MEEKELQEKVLAYRMLEAQLDGLLKQRDLVVNKISEIKTTIETIKDVEDKTDDILIPIGSEAYKYGKLSDKKTMIVEIGANVALEKTVDEAKQTLNAREKELETALESLQGDIGRATHVMRRLGPELQLEMDKLRAK